VSAYDETRRISTTSTPGSEAPPDAATTQIRAPGPLDLTGPSEADTTNVLRLDELFETAPAAQPAQPAPAAQPAQPAVAQPAVARPAEPQRRVGTAPVASGEKRPSALERVLDDAAAVWDGAMNRGERWLRSGDNALMAVTALAAIVLILVVATFGA